jgi:bacterioferritin-associated ferredoxin
VTDREIRRLARNGAASTREIARSCGAGSCCGGCRASIAAILSETEQEPRSAILSLPAAPEAV